MDKYHQSGIKETKGFFTPRIESNRTESRRNRSRNRNRTAPPKSTPAFYLSSLVLSSPALLDIDVFPTQLNTGVANYRGSWRKTKKMRAG